MKIRIWDAEKNLVLIDEELREPITLGQLVNAPLELGMAFAPTKDRIVIVGPQILKTCIIQLTP